MHYILSASVPGLYVRFLKREGDLCAVTRDGHVIDTSSAARSLGLEPGMPLPFARTHTRGVQFVEWNPDDDLKVAETWLAPLLEVSDRIEVVDPHHAYIDLSAHRDPIEFAERVRSQVPPGTQLGLGSSKWIACAAAAAGALSSDFVVRPAQALSGMSVVHLPVDADIVRRLVFLGYRTIGEVQAVEESVLKEHFGAVGSTLYRAARGGCSHPVAPNFPPGTIRARIQPQGAWNDSQARTADLSRLASRAAKPLIDQDRTALSLCVVIDSISGESVVISRMSPRPMRTAHQILIALEAACAGIHGEVSEIRLALGHLQDGSNRQLEWERMRVAETPQGLADAVSTVRARFGQRALQPASELPVPRRRRVLQSWKNATGWQ